MTVGFFDAAIEISRSFAGEDRVALFEEGTRAFASIFRLHDLAAVFHLDGERIGFGYGFGFAQRGKNALHREWPIAGDALGDFSCLVKCLAVGNNVVHKTEFIRTLGSEIFASEKHLCCNGVTDLTAESHGRASHREQAALDFSDAEDCAFTSDANIGALKNFGSTSAGVPLSGKDHGLGGPVGLEPAAKNDFGLVFETLKPLVVDDAFTKSADFCEVHAGAERVALTGEDGDAK